MSQPIFNARIAVPLVITIVVMAALGWFVFFMAVKIPPPMTASLGPEASVVITFLIAIGLSIPAVALFAFGQVVGDVRTIRNSTRAQSDHLAAMRAYYEPGRRQRAV